MIIREQEPMSAHTTFRIGGPAAYYLIPENGDEVSEALVFAKEKGLPFYVLDIQVSLLRSEEAWSRCQWRRNWMEQSMS